MILLGVLGACGPADTNLGVAVDKLPEPLLVDPEALWSDGQVNMCFLPDDPPNSRLTAKYGKIVVEMANVWANVSGLRFVGWAGCTQRDSGKRANRIQFHRVRGNGAWWVQFHSDFTATDMSESMHLETSLGDEKGDPHYFRYSMLHELGHVLGFDHEQMRHDTPQAYTDPICDSHDMRSQGPQEMTVGRWDLGSIMNYCNPGFTGGPPRLSKSDVAGVQKFYGKPRPHMHTRSTP